MNAIARTRVLLVGVLVLMTGSMASVVPAADTYQEIQVLNGGTVAGMVRFTGPIPQAQVFELKRAPDRDFCGALSDGSGYRSLQEVAVGPEGGLKDVVVTIENVSKGKPFELRETHLDANVCQFFPFVSIVRQSHLMTVKNLDPVSHDLQVYERDRNAVFIMFHRPSLTQTGTTDRIMFSGGRREMIMQCGMHPYMQAHGLGVQNPYYAVTGLDGVFQITDLPPGTYRIRAWHPLLLVDEHTVTVTANGAVSLDFTFEYKPLGGFGKAE